MPSPDRAFVPLLRMQLRELAAARSYWLLLAITGFLVGHAFVTATATYAEASGIGGGPAALSQGLNPLEGFLVPTLGAYDLVATLLLPFVVIRLFGADQHFGALTLTLQFPVAFGRVVAAKGLALLLGWLAAGIPACAALILWSWKGGHLYAPEVATLALGHLLRGALTIGLGAACATVTSNAASGAILALTVTIGSWAVDYVAAARGGWVATLAPLTPSAALRVFEHGELRASTAIALLILAVAGLGVATLWSPSGIPVMRRATAVTLLLASTLLGVGLAQRVRESVDVSEDRRNSFSEADEHAIAQIAAPVRVTIYLAAQDPRLADLERESLAKLRRALPRLTVVYAAKGRTGLFERPQDHYGEVWYESNGRRIMSRSVDEAEVLATIYALTGRRPPVAAPEPEYRGYPLAESFAGAGFVFFLGWPVLVGGIWWVTSRAPRPRHANPLR